MNTAHYTVDGEVAVLTLDNPPVNGLSIELRIALAAGLDRAQADPAVKAIVITGAGGVFCGGADLRQINTPQYWAYPRTIQLAHLLDQIAKPVVAVIDGLALGGGLELALGCHYRLATASARLALPEVRLGLLPGGGATLRLPRLVGLESAVRMMLDGAMTGAREALASGLIDAVIDAAPLPGGIAYARAIAARGQSVRRARDLPVPADGGAEFFRECRRGLAPGRARAAILACVEAGVTLPFEEAVRLTDEATRELMESDEAAALRYLFFAEREAGKPDSATVPSCRIGRATRVRHAAVPERTGWLAASMQEAGEITVLLDCTGNWRVEQSSAVAGADDDDAALRALVGADLIVVDADDETVQRELLRAAGHYIRAETMVALIRGQARIGDASVDIMARDALRLYCAPVGKLAEIQQPDRADANLAAVVRYVRDRGGKAVLTRGARAPIWELVVEQARSCLAQCAEAGLDPVDIGRALRQIGFGKSAVDVLLSGVLPENRCVEPEGPVTEAANEAVRVAMGRMAQEGARLLEMRCVARASDVDVAMVGAGLFPATLGGPMYQVACQAKKDAGG